MREDLISRLPASLDTGKPHPPPPAPKLTSVFPVLRHAARTGLALADSVCWPLSRRLVREAPSLITVALHSLSSTVSRTADPALAPDLNVSVAELRQLVEIVLESGYTIVSPGEVDAGLDPGGRYVMLTFDDGYFNNVLALDVLAEFRIPATFFISSNHVLEQKAFWWDALNRELVKAGASGQQRDDELRKVKRMRVDSLDAYLHQRFGAAALRPEGDDDRPFTATELASFARHPWVHLGNHTSDHAILTHCSLAEMRRQLQDCQEVLTGIAGYAPIAVSYPNGNYSPAVVEAARAAGLRVGLTVRPHRNRLPLSTSDLMALGRFFYHGDNCPRQQFARWRSGFVPTHLIKTLMRPV